MSFRLLRRVLMLASLCMIAASVSRAQTDLELPEDVEINADEMEYDSTSNMLTGSGHVEVIAGEYTMTAARMVYDVTSGDVTASGGVFLRGPDVMWSGDELGGNLKTKTFNFGEYEAGYGRWLVKGESAYRDEDGVVHIQNVRMTTCDAWWLEARSIEHRPDGSFVARDVVYRVYGVPVMRLPVVKGTTDRDSLPFETQFGYSGDWGFMLFVAKEWAINENLTTRFQAELRTGKGVGLTNETTYNTENTQNRLRLAGYYDYDPLTDETINGTDYNKRFETEEWRYRVYGEHRSDWQQDRLTLRLRGEHVSDPDLIFEYYRSEYRDNPQTASIADIAFTEDRYEISLSGRARLNDFETTLERLPELRFYMPRQGVFGTPLEYESDTSLAYLRMSFPEFDLARTDGLADSENYESARFDSLHILLLPLRLNSVNVIPRAAVRLTWYERGPDSKVTDELLNRQFALNARRVSPDLALAPAAYGDDGSGATRLAGELGLEVNTKIYATWFDYKSDLLKLDGLRHIIVPYINYTYMPSPSEDKEDLLFFDSTDRLDQANFVRLGVKQRFQTRRNQQIYTFATVETYADFHAESNDDRGTAGDLGILATLRPREEFGLSTKLLFDMDSGEINAASIGLDYGKPKSWNAQISYLYRNDFTSRYTYSMASDLTHIMSTNAIPQSFTESHGVGLNFQIPLGQKMRFRTYHYFDLDQGQLGLQRYELERDLKCWTVILRVDEESGDVRAVILLSLRGTSAFKPTVGSGG